MIHVIYVLHILTLHYVYSSGVRSIFQWTTSRCPIISIICGRSYIVQRTMYSVQCTSYVIIIEYLEMYLGAILKSSSAKIAKWKGVKIHIIRGTISRVILWLSYDNHSIYIYDILLILIETGKLERDRNRNNHIVYDYYTMIGHIIYAFGIHT